MSPIKKIKVNNLDISISIESNKDDYFCLTDIIKDKEGEDHIRNWMRNKNTIVSSQKMAIDCNLYLRCEQKF